MRFLFIHPNFPAQFKYLLQALLRSGKHELVFLTENKSTNWALKGLRKIVVPEAPPPLFETSSALTPFLEMEARGQTFLQASINLKQAGFIPDVIVFHSGWGASWYLADIFAESRRVGYFEWFYHHNDDNSSGELKTGKQLSQQLQARMRNATINNDLLISHQKISATQWQRSQFPAHYQKEIKVIHEGIDTNYFVPDPEVDLALLDSGIPPDVPLITYASRGMEPFRGFPQFIKSLKYVLLHNEKCHVVIMGDDRICYSPPRADGKTYKELMEEEVELDWSRVHFVGSLPYGKYKQVLQASAVHVYLTLPFVLSWSLLEAMSCGCVIIGSNTQPVREVIVDGENGILAELDSPEEIGKKISGVLSFPKLFAAMREKARETIIKRYELQPALVNHLKILLPD